MDSKNNNRLIRLIPNGLTLGRLVLTIIFLIMILYAPQLEEPKPSRFLLIAFIIFLIAGLTDIIDGKVARMFNVTSKFGRMLDPLADKILVCGAFVCFAIVARPTFLHILDPGISSIIHWATAIIIIVRELFVTILRHIAEARGVNFAATASGKIKMFLQSFGIGTVIIKWAYVSRAWGNWFTITAFAIMLVVTVISGVSALKRPIK